MEKPTNQAPAPAVDRHPSDNYISSAGPPPEYPPGEHQPHGQQQQPYELPKYGAQPQDPNAYYGAQQQPQQPQQPFGGPQNFAPYGTPLPALGPHPAPIECPDCHARGVTAVEYSSGGFTHSLAAIVCFVTCLGCIPYFFTSLKDARHKCAKCGIPLATYHRSGRTEVHWHGAYRG
ncbi:litaf-like zinc finger domain-containing protein [Colletotrichum truncatum]|uniref:Litaf-like zinc finger domain-containing protein n=1 Tax=Colletotrichum truncatum TaxID=5467 RepID=A0ACC3YRW5_COLTU|nr:litaf-like zinc finger domain-containing protein [Colletotrichum truncatum]KAF6799323.1 litaf-like zinc finger domain-containing protein [Colletotrichum truncatum]